MSLAVYYAAMYVSELWHGDWRANGRLYAKARAMVIFDRIMTGRCVEMERKAQIKRNGGKR